MPAEALWQRAAWLMQPTIMRELHASPFSPAPVEPGHDAPGRGSTLIATIVVARCGLFARRGLALSRLPPVAGERARRCGSAA